MPDEPTILPEEQTLPADVGEAKPLPAELTDSVSFGRWLAELVVLVGLAFVLAQGIKTFIVQPFMIPSGSMEPTLDIGDRVLVNKFVYRFTTPHRGDVVVFLAPRSQNMDYIKRVVAVAGDKVDIVNGRVVVNGRVANEPYIHGKRSDIGSKTMPLIVPKGEVFLMGDNRTNSTDSRWFGPQPVKRILGKVFGIYWPVTHVGAL